MVKQNAGIAVLRTCSRHFVSPTITNRNELLVHSDYYYDKRCVASDVGADVLLATTDLHLRTTDTCKLIPIWVGPSKVPVRMDGTAYHLHLPDCMHQVIHSVFHVSLIKPYRSDGCAQPSPPPELADDCPAKKVEQVLDHRVVSRG